MLWPLTDISFDLLLGELAEKNTYADVVVGQNSPYLFMFFMIVAEKR